MNHDPKATGSHLEELITELAPGVLRYCRARTGDPTLAEEVAQEALAALVSRWRSGEPPRSPEAFVFTVARRRAARQLRRRRLTAPLDLLFGLRDPNPDPEIRARDRQHLGRVRRLLSELSPRDREALLLAAAGDLDTATAARALGISKSAYKMRLHRARRRLDRLTGTVAPLHSSLEVSDESTP
jgi:RNA polymerase sigma-70 factor (ECF subfamily)